MAQYKTQYGTVFAVKEHNGSPAIMCRAEVSETWSLSSMITPFTPGAWTAEELQGQLDNWAATKGWQPVEAPASTEPPEIVDEGSGPEDGFPDWVRPMVEAFLQFPFFRELPAFTAFAIRHSEAVRHRQGGTLADGVYDAGPKGIKFFVFPGPNSDQYREVHYAWADFVRRCKAAGLEPEPHQDKEDAPCNTEPTAPTGAAAATTDGIAAPEPPQAAETSTGSPGNSADASSCPSAEPVRQAPAALPLSAPDTAPTSLPEFDFASLDAETAEKLRGITDCVMELYQTYAWGMAYQVGRAHDLLCGDGGSCETVSQLHKANGNRGENTFTAWCAYIGVERRSAYNLLNAYRLICKATPEQQRNLQLAPAKLLYEAGKKDVPDQLADAVMNGDITKTKQFLDAKREWQAKLDAEHAAREQAEQQRDEAATHIQAARDMQIDTARERDAALRRAAEAENRAAGAQKLADQRGDENTALKAQIRDLESRPVEVAVAQPGEEQIEAWRKEGEDRAAAALQDRLRKADQAKADAQRQVNALQTELAAARPDADACQRTADTLYETAENLRILLRTQLKQAQLSPTAYGKVVAHVLQVARTLLDTVRVCAPDGYDIDSEEDDDFE